MFPNDSTDLDSFTYVTVDAAHAWGNRQLAINWMALTWNGTGFDRNLVSEDGLALRARSTPRGVPFGALQSSHYYPGRSNVVHVNPDADLHRYPTFVGRQTGIHNEIVFPYVLATMDLYRGRYFVLPAFNPYRANDPITYRYFVVRDRVVVQDDQGHQHEAWRVEGASRATLDDARSLHDDFPNAFARYFISEQPPYFLGKEWIAWTDEAGRAVTKRWRMTRHQLLEVSPADRLERIVQVRARRAGGQVTPWHLPAPTGR